MTLSKFDLKGKVAIVTGSNTGLGQGIAIALAEAGAKVMGISTSPSQETMKIIGENNFSYMVANLKTTEPVKRIISNTVEKFGRVDILVNNAGRIIRQDAIEYTEEAWDEVLNINLKTLFFLSQEVAKQFIKQGQGGKIINIASMLSYQGGIRVPSYTSSKSAVKGLTMALANEWAKHNINVNSIAPGYMATNNTKPLREDKKRSSEILARIPAGRWGTPDDLKGIAIFLASDASDYVNGCTIPVDGGWLGR